MPNLEDLQAFVAIARAGGFREAARISHGNASSLSAAMRRLETDLGVRLLNRTTRSVAPTQAGNELLSRLSPALREIETALDELNIFRDRPAGTLRLNVPVSAARLVLPAILPGFLDAYPEISVDVVTDENFVDLPESSCDAGIRYEERLTPDMIAVPIGPRVQRCATAAAPSYLDAFGRPEHPNDLLSHNCIRGRFPSGSVTAFEFERKGEVVIVEPKGRLIVTPGGATDLAVMAAIQGAGVIHLFEDWLRPHFASGELEPILTGWWQDFSGPFLYYPGRRLVPSPLRAFIDYVRQRTPS